MSYTPDPISEGSALGIYVEKELQKIANALQALDADYIEFKVHYVLPDKPRAGQVYYADGTSWNPGSGEGLYRYSIGGAWVHLG